MTFSTVDTQQETKDIVNIENHIQTDESKSQATFTKVFPNNLNEVL